jgi:YD repeat-containing protein
MIHGSGRPRSRHLTGKKNFFKYDAKGNLVAVQLSGKVYQDEYDANGRLIKRTNPDKSWVSFSYDELGVKVKERYSDRTETTFKYDGRNRIVSVSGSHSDSISNIYNDKGLLASTTVIKLGDPDKKELTTAYSYDERGRKIKKALPDGSEEKTVYFDNNDIIKIRNGVITYSKYDSCGRISAVSEYPQDLFEEAETKEEKRKIFEENIVKKYSYNLLGDLVGIENIPKKQGSVNIYTHTLFAFVGTEQGDNFLYMPFPAKSL